MPTPKPPSCRSRRPQRPTGKIAGIHAFSIDDAQKRIAQGYRFMTVMAETRMIRAGATAVLQALRG